MMSLLFNMLLRFAIAFLPRNKHLLISWLQSPPAVILEPKKLKSATASPFPPSICHLVMGLYAMINAKFFNAKFQPSLFTLLFYPLKRPFRSSSLPLEWYHLHIWGCRYFSWQSLFQLVIDPDLHFKPGNNIQPWCTPFPILNQSVVPCLVLTVASWPTYRFLRRQVRWSGTPVSKNFPLSAVTHTIKGFSVVNEAEVDISLELPCLLHDPMNVDNLISCSSAFSKSSLYIWKFSVYVLLKSRLERF